MSDYLNKGANALGINIYGSILKDKNKFNEYIQAFIDLYSTLDNYGTHLIKDVWDNFYYLCK